MSIIAEHTAQQESIPPLPPFLLEDVPFGFESLMDRYLAVRVKEMVTIPTTTPRRIA
jgi:hypothetical protein